MSKTFADVKCEDCDYVGKGNIEVEAEDTTRYSCMICGSYNVKNVTIWKKVEENETSLSNKTMLIVGASGAIGQGLVEHYKGKVKKLYGTYFQNKPTDDSSVEYYGYAVSGNQLPENTWAYIDIIIYVSGITENAMMHKMSWVKWQRAMSINLGGAFTATGRALSYMRTKRYGRIIFISSILEKISVPGTAAYTVSKAGLSALARVIAVENATKGITANSITLGYLNTGIIRDVPERYLNETVIPSIPQKKLGTIADVTLATDYLIAADYVTGTSLNVSGGL